MEPKAPTIGLPALPAEAPKSNKKAGKVKPSTKSATPLQKEHFRNQIVSPNRANAAVALSALFRSAPTETDATETSVSYYCIVLRFVPSCIGRRGHSSTGSSCDSVERAFVVDEGYPSPISLYQQTTYVASVSFLPLIRSLVRLPRMTIPPPQITMAQLLARNSKCRLPLSRSQCHTPPPTIPIRTEPPPTVPFLTQSATRRPRMAPGQLLVRPMAPPEE